MNRKAARRLAAVLIVLIVLSAAALLAAHRPALSRTGAPARDAFRPAVVAAGARVAAVGDCMFCHTAEGGRPFAGGRPIRTPFGVVYSTNITPDAATGIGDWSLQAFARAMRRGVSRDGHLLYPAFPYPHFTHMTREDVRAVYAFMMTRDPVKNVAPANRLAFPLNFRPLLAGWNLLFLHPGALPAGAPEQGAAWRRGRYLVEGPGHCGACHTPMNRLGAEKRGAAFSGGIADGWDSPALDAHSPAPRRWTQQQLAAFLHTGLASEHGAAAGPMLPATRALAAAPAADIEAMAVYLVSLQRPGPAGGAGAAPAPLGEPARRGALLFSAACASCHGAGAAMQAGGGRPALDLSSTLHADSPRNVINLILGGIPLDAADTLPRARTDALPGAPADALPRTRAAARIAAVADRTAPPRALAMPPFGPMFDDQQVADLAAYLREGVARRAPWPDLDATVACIRKENNPP